MNKRALSPCERVQRRSTFWFSPSGIRLKSSQRPRLRQAVFRLFEIFGVWRPAAAQEQVKRERAAEEVVFVGLRGGRNLRSPTFASQRFQVKTFEQDETGRGHSQSCQKRCECGFPHS
jgi:hypothetical protein